MSIKLRFVEASVQFTFRKCGIKKYNTLSESKIYTSKCRGKCTIYFPKVWDKKYNTLSESKIYTIANFTT